MLAPPVPVKVNVVVLMVAGFIGVLKVAVMTALLGHVVAEPLGGVTTVTVGGGHGGEVVNDQVKLAVSELPKVSRAPVVMVAVKVVFDARAAEGVKVATLVAAA
jgi:hypothetical protein